MEFVLAIYGSGVLFTAILLILLAQYYIKYTKDQYINIEQTIIICFLSWLIAIPMIIIYRDKYKKLFSELFKPNENEKEEI